MEEQKDLSPNSMDPEKQKLLTKEGLKAIEQSEAKNNKNSIPNGNTRVICQLKKLNSTS